ncbi:ABC transporter substrate-binding protein [Neobacillus muris]|uniref:ABC transporter substrate-binding protein n=1 Tax=Neobacillus muris TaxID=2941334 RepID=UPI00203EEA98|nr:ABC transporter substrate-binding protein [Neobacillus muris]
MNKSRLLGKAMSLLLIVMLALTGCNKYNQESSGEGNTSENNGTNASAKPSDPNVFNFATNQDIPHLDPHGTSANTSFRVTYMLYDRLVTYDGTDTEVKPQLAEKWDISDDGLTYTFYLNKEAKFHDGTPVTAEAVKYSFTRAIDVGKSAAGQFKGVINKDSFEIVDDHTIKIKLEQPFAPFIKTLGTVFGNIVNPKLAEHHGDDLGESYIADKDMGSGPYVLESWDRGQKLVLKANEDYWGTSPTMKTVNIQIVNEPSTARLMLEKGEIDLIDDTMLSPDVMKQMEDTEGIEIVKSPGYAIDDIAINMEKEPLDNVKVRQALAYAVNYDSINKDILLDAGKRVGGIIPEGMFGYNPDVKLYDFDLEKAKALLKEAGYEKGFDLELLISENNEVRKNIAVMMQSDLKQIGINLNIKTLAWPTFLETVTSGGHQLALASWTPDYPDPDYNLWYFAHSSSKGPGFNLAYFDNKNVDQLLEEGRKTVDENRREEIYKEIQTIMNDEVPYIFPSQRLVEVAKREWVKGFEINPMNTWYVPFQKITKE